MTPYAGEPARHALVTIAAGYRDGERVPVFHVSTLREGRPCPAAIQMAIVHLEGLRRDFEIPYAWARLFATPCKLCGWRSTPRGIRQEEVQHD